MKSKAFILLTIFLLNTVLGLACSLHLSPNLGYSEADAHEHGAHAHSDDHHHPENKADHHSLGLNSLQDLTDEADACCQDEAEVFNLLAKNLSSAGKNTNLKAPVFFILPTFFSAYLQVIPEQSKTTFFVNYRKPPNSVDIRVSISSFLI